MGSHAVDLFAAARLRDNADLYYETSEVDQRHFCTITHPPYLQDLYKYMPLPSLLLSTFRQRITYLAHCFDRHQVSPVS